VTLEIPLTQGQVALVDEADYEALVAAGKWQALPAPNTFYAFRKSSRRDGKRLGVYMHTLLTGWPYVDHIDGNGLDNRRQNLRAATHSKNMMNRGPQSNNTSGFKGVCRNRLKWRAQIGLDGRHIHLGTFATPQEAAHAYDAAAVELFGEYARPNFLQEITV